MANNPPFQSVDHRHCESCSIIEILANSVNHNMKRVIATVCKILVCKIYDVSCMLEVLPKPRSTQTEGLNLAINRDEFSIRTN